MKLDIYDYWKVLCGVFLLTGYFLQDNYIIMMFLFSAGIGGGATALIMDSIVKLNTTNK